MSFHFHPIHAHVSSSLSVVLFLPTFYFLLYFTFILFLFMANSSDSMNLNTLCNFANGTFVTLDDCLPDTKSVWKEKGKSKDKSKEGTSDTSNTNCSFCKGNDCPKSLRRPAEKKTMSHGLSKLTMIDSDSSIHVCPLNSGPGDGFRKSSKTKPMPRAEMQQREMRLMICDNEAGRVIIIYNVLDMRRSIWSLRSMLDSGFDVYFTMDRRWIARTTGKNLT